MSLWILAIIILHFQKKREVAISPIGNNDLLSHNNDA